MSREIAERYVHLAQCADDLNEAWRILKHIQRYRRNRLAGAAFQFAIILYARPYKTSYGTVIARHRLDDRFVPPELMSLHTRLLDSRDRVQAHSDLTVRDARIAVARVGKGRFVSVVQNVVHGAELLRQLGEFVTLIERSLTAMYGELKSIEPALPDTLSVP